MATQRNKWDDFAPEHALLGGIVERAVRDALQTTNEALHRDAWEFLQICAPTVADKLLKVQQERG